MHHRSTDFQGPDNPIRSRGMASSQWRFLVIATICATGIITNSSGTALAQRAGRGPIMAEKLTGSATRTTSSVTVRAPRRRGRCGVRRKYKRRARPPRFTYMLMRGGARPDCHNSLARSIASIRIAVRARLLLNRSASCDLRAREDQLPSDQQEKRGRACFGAIRKIVLLLSQKKAHPTKRK